MDKSICETLILNLFVVKSNKTEPKFYLGSDTGVPGLENHIGYKIIKIMLKKCLNQKFVKNGSEGELQCDWFGFME